MMVPIEKGDTINDANATAVSPSAAHLGAQQMGAMGFSVFPLHGINAKGACTCGNATCLTPGKHPHHMGSMATATTDIDTINGWFQKQPTLNYGVRLGREVGNTGKMPVVIDVDSYKPGGAESLEALEATHGRLPETAEVLSGAGGRHCYYWANSSLSFAGTMGKNIDLKVNGYVVGPGSRHVKGKYYDWEGSSNPFEGQAIADLPEWISTKFSKGKRDELNAENAATTEPLMAYEVRSIKDDLSYISAASSRAEWLNILMALHDRNQSMEMFRIADEWSQGCPEKYDAGDVIKAWNSFKPGGGITYASIYLMALEERIKDVDISKLLARLNCTLAPSLSDAVSADDANAVLAAPELRYRMRSADDLANAPPIQWMIRSLLPRTGLAALYGPSGCGKSFLALDLAVSVAGGTDEWYGMRIKNCPVTYCVLEGEGGMGKRTKAWAKHHGKQLPNALQFVTQPVNLLYQGDVGDLAAAILAADGGAGLVILDTLNRAAPEADENSSKDMGAIIAAAKALQMAVGGLVILVHHTGKNAGQGMRGHSSLFAAMDSVIGVTKSQWEVAKSKDDATGALYSFKLETLDLGVDDEGDVVTSCVAVPVAAAFALRKSKKLGPHQMVALDTIVGMGTDFVSAIHVDKAIAAVAEKLIDVDTKHKRERAKTAIGALIDMGKLCSENNYIRPL